MRSLVPHIVAYKDSYWSDPWSEKCLEEMNVRKQEIFFRKPSSGMTSGKVFPAETNPAVCVSQVTIGYVNRDIRVDLLLRKTRDQH